MVGVLVGCSERVPRSVFEWVQGRNIAAGSTQSLDLPASLRGGSKDGKVHVARLSDGRLCVMLKTRIGFKDNFKGAVRCSDPLRKNEVVKNSKRPYLSLAGHGIFEELYIRKQINEHEYKVLFDLN